MSPFDLRSTNYLERGLASEVGKSPYRIINATPYMHERASFGLGLRPLHRTNLIDHSSFYQWSVGFGFS